jgi:hypothetical protein
MQWLGRLLLASFAGVAIAVGAAASPPGAAACSCLSGIELADLVGEIHGVVVVAGRVGPAAGDGTHELAVERWFAGPGPAARIRVVGDASRDGAGVTVTDSCGMRLTPRAGMLLSGTRDDRGRLQPSICLPHGDLGAGGGRALIAEAEAAFGPGIGFEPDAPEEVGPAAEPEPAGAVPLFVAIGAIAILCVAAFTRGSRVADDSGSG